MVPALSLSMQVHAASSFHLMHMGKVRHMVITRWAARPVGYPWSPVRRAPPFAGARVTAVAASAGYLCVLWFGEVMLPSEEYSVLSRVRRNQLRLEIDQSIGSPKRMYYVVLFTFT